MPTTGRRGTHGWTERLAIVLVVTLGLLWVGAKIHFFTRFGKSTVEAYILEHWPFWAAMALVGVLIFIVGTVERRRRS